ncbi:MAG: leucyl aminopeptidase [bacterium]|nr:leucyl aminopeptidase [bacterium]
MHWTAGSGRPEREKTDLIVLGVTRRRDKPDLKPWLGLAPDLLKRLSALSSLDAFAAKTEQLHLLGGAGTRAPWILVLGLGPADELSPQSLRCALGAASQRARTLGAKACVLALPWAALGGLEPDAIVRCCVEGAELALFDAGACKAHTGGERKPAPKSWKILAPAALRPAVSEGAAAGFDYAQGCLFARDLVNRPANLLGPRELAAEARAMARREGLTCTVMGEAQLRRRGMGGVLGVAQGSARPPQFVVLEYAPRGAGRRRPLIALVGKGVTFDSGGISIKPALDMHEMKGDMGGAAAVLGAAMIAARRGLRARLLVVVPAVENMPDGGAIRPGDVLTMASGKTVEVLNTDAEGRLILADALHYACQQKPDYVIDAATLTGACVVALGDEFAGLFCNHTDLGDALDRAGGDTFERVWPLPLVKEHHKLIESGIADLQNIGGKCAGASTAAAFLAEFVDDETPWAHLDIAGPAWTAKPGPLGPKGATGYGARLIARALEILADRAD